MGNNPPEGEDKKWVGFEATPEELIESGLIKPEEFEILAYTPPERRGEPTVIDADEYEEAVREARDPNSKLGRFLRKAKEYGEQVEREGH